MKHVKSYKIFEAIDESIIDTVKAYINELEDSDDLGYWNVKLVPEVKFRYDCDFYIDLYLDVPDSELEWEQYLPEGWTQTISSLINFMESSGYTHVVHFDDGFETNVIHFEDLGRLSYYSNSEITIKFRE
jgi:hypothetical protein